MTKLLLCLALFLAMTHIVSADVPTFDLALDDYALLTDEVDYLTQNCQTTDGKLYYGDLDVATKTAYLQVWDTNAQEAGDAINITPPTIQAAIFVAALGNGTTTQSALRCLGTDVYLALAYSNTNTTTNTTISGIELFLLTSSATPVPTYSLPLNYTDLVSDQKEYLAQICATTDGKFYYIDGDNGGNLLQVWDSTNQSLATPISLASVVSQISTLRKESGKLIKTTSALQCIGTSPYFSFAYLNSTSRGNVLFLAQSDAPVPTYNLSVQVVLESVDDYLSSTCQTSDGKFYYLDATTDSAVSYTLQSWDSGSQTAADGVSLTDAENQVFTFAGDYSESVIVLQCIGKDVYSNVAYSNSTDGGIKLFWLNKSSAGMVRLSYVAVLLALVALLL